MESESIQIDSASSILHLTAPSFISYIVISKIVFTLHHLLLFLK